MNRLLVVFFISSLLLSCQKDNPTVKRDVYVVGVESNSIGKDVAKYWKNGVAVRLTNGAEHGEANSLVVFNNDVYIAGYDGSIPSGVVWKNNVAIQSLNGYPKSIFVSGNDIFVAGYGTNKNTGKDIAMYWKNGIATTLSDGSNGAEAFWITVSNNDVYVAGYESSPGGTTTAKYWKKWSTHFIDRRDPHGYGKQHFCIR